MTPRHLTLPLILTGCLLASACDGGEATIPESTTPEPTDPEATQTAEPTQPAATATATAQPTAPQGTEPIATEPGETEPAVTPTQGSGTPRDTPTPGEITPTSGQDIDRDGYPAAVDCDDLNPGIHPGADETCDEKDEDCDDVVDEDLTSIAQFPDQDRDGYGSDDGEIAGCILQPGYVEIGGDCNDADPDVNPETPWYRDQDGDGYGADDDSVTQCLKPQGYISQGGDCDDNDAGHSPATPEHCDGADENCDGHIDDGTECADDDGDGFCEGPTCNDGATPGDCDDDAPWTSPASPERYDFQDNDCDGNPESGRVFPLNLAHISLDGYLLGSHAGKALAGGGNINGDKSRSGHDLDDLIIGAPFHDPQGQQVGAAFVVLGREIGWPGQPTSLADLDDTLTFTEEQESASAGDAVAFIGDMNADGYDDFAIGAPQSGGVTGQLTHAGSAYVFLGHPGRWTSGTAPAMATTRIDGTGIDIELGSSVAGGDVTGDLYSDFIVGAPSQSDGAASNAGWVFVLPGTADNLPPVAGPSTVYKMLGDANAGIGTTLAFMGHHDDSGFNSFAIAGLYTSQSEGYVQRLNGSAAFGIPNVAPARPSNLRNGAWTGAEPGERTGFRMAGNADVDHDGYTDLLIGRHYRSGVGNASIAYMVRGGSDVTSDLGAIEDAADVRFASALSDPCPCSVTSVGDMDGDGIDDFAIGAAFAPPDETPGTTNYQGRVFLFYGRETPWPETVDVEAEADAVFMGVVVAGRAGYAISSAGDINGDGYDDLAIGAPYVSHGEGEDAVNQSGRVYIQLGAPRP